MLRDPRAFYHGAYADALVVAVSDGGALSQEDLDAYHVIESTPRSVRVNDFTVHARGNDLDDLLGTMERVAPVVHGDPTTDAHSAAALIDALRAPASGLRRPTSSPSTSTATAA